MPIRHRHYSYDITVVNKEGVMDMCTCNGNGESNIEERIEQHEQVISQLIEMVALTNRQLMQMMQEERCSHVRTPTS